MATKPVLVVEDEPDGQELMIRMLSQVNRHADVARNAEEAWQKLLNQTYAAVIIDLALPGMDGFELFRAIRHVPALAKTPCVAVTAFHTPELKQHALQLGFEAYFAKPIDRLRFLDSFTTLIAPSAANED